MADALYTSAGTLELKRGVVTGLSIGFDRIKSFIKDGARHLSEIRLHEISLVTLAANPMAQVIAVKASNNLEPQILQFQRMLEECRNAWR